ncbi:MAG: hypothetical protein AB8B85_03270 [Paracoccaceae bacterium]
MPEHGQDNAGCLAHVIEDIDLGLRSFPRGTRQLGETCRLTVAVNSEECLHFDEEAGDLAPREIVIDIRTETTGIERLLSGLRTRPWASADSPVIVCADAAEKSGISYLIRTREISDIVEAIRDGLDIVDPGLPSQANVRLDAAAGGE